MEWKRPPPTAQDRAVAAGDELLARARELTLRAEVQRQDRQPRQADLSEAHAARYAQQAIDKYEQAVKLGPSRPDAHYRAYVAARYYLKGNDERTHEKIIEHGTRFREVAPLDPRHFDVTEDLCHALARLGALRAGTAADTLYDRAVKEYDLLVSRIDPIDAEASRSIGTIYSNAAELLMAVGRIDEAIAYYERAIASDPHNSLNLYGLAVAYDRDGQVQKAAEAMRAAIQRDQNLEQILHADEPGWPVYFVPQGDKQYYLALAFLVRGDKREAVRRFEAFLTQAKSAKKQYVDRAREHLRELKAHAAR